LSGKELEDEALRRLDHIRSLSSRDAGEKKPAAPAPAEDKRSDAEPAKKGPTWSMNPMKWDWADTKGSAQAAPSAPASKPPAAYPDAKWSPKHNGWFIQKDGKFFQVTP
jgi:hypothetical protein